MIRVLAYGMTLLFYHRQVRSHARGHCDGFVRRQLFLRIDDNYFSRSTTITF
jgi:hypothetical protein